MLATAIWGLSRSHLTSYSNVSLFSSLKIPRSVTIWFTSDTRITVQISLLETIANLYSGAVQYEINVFGPVKVIRAVLPQLREQGSGTIVNMSSVGGLRSGPAAGMYCSTKWALEGITESLADEIAPFGLRALSK